MSRGYTAHGLPTSSSIRRAYLRVLNSEPCRFRLGLTGLVWESAFKAVIGMIGHVLRVSEDAGLKSSSQSLSTYDVKAGSFLRGGRVIVGVEVQAPTGEQDAVEFPCSVRAYLLDDNFSKHVAKSLKELSEREHNNPRKSSLELLIFRVLGHSLENPSSPYFQMQLFAEREDKKELAIDFLKRVYAPRLRDGSVTMTELKKVDLKLWDALRKWGARPGNDLGKTIRPGVPKVGRPRIDNDDELQKLDPTNEADAVTLALAELRKRQREATRKHRAKAAPTRPEARKAAPGPSQ